FARAAVALPGGSGIWTRSGVSESGPGKLCAVRCSWNHFNDHTVQLGVLRNGPALGQAVRVSKRDAGGAGSPYSRHAGQNLGRGDSRRNSGTAGGGRLFYRGFPGSGCNGDSNGAAVHMPDWMFVVSAGDSYRI